MERASTAVLFITKQNSPFLDKGFCVWYNFFVV